MPSSRPTKTYLAFDFGAESGRAVLAHLHAGTIRTEEVHRFPNEPVSYGGSLHWDIARLWWEVGKALAKLDKTKLEGIGVDAWGVDYALLGDRGELLQNPYHYRDTRTNGVMEEVFQIVSKEEIYGITGIQFMPINTLYQLFAAKQKTPRIFEAAEHLLTIPDLFHYWLTGNAACEFTSASTTQMLNPATRNWASDLLNRLGFPLDLPARIVEPGSVIGTLLLELARGSFLSGTPVIVLPSHDPGSAVTAFRSSHSGCARQDDSGQPGAEVSRRNQECRVLDRAADSANPSDRRRIEKPSVKSTHGGCNRDESAGWTRRSDRPGQCCCSDISDRWRKLLARGPRNHRSLIPYGSVRTA